MENLGAIALMWVNMLVLTHFVGLFIYVIYMSVGFATGLLLNTIEKRVKDE